MRLSHRNVREAILTQSHRHGYLNNTLTTMTPMDMLTWKEKSLWGPKLDRTASNWGELRTGEMLFLSEELPKWLLNTKW